MDNVDITHLLEQLLAAMTTSSWAEVILMLVLLVVFIGGGYLIYKRMEYTERLLLKMLDIIAPRYRKRQDSVETEEDSESGS